MGTPVMLPCETWTQRCSLSMRDPDPSWYNQTKNTSWEVRSLLDLFWWGARISSLCVPMAWAFTVPSDSLWESFLVCQAHSPSRVDGLAQKLGTYAPSKSWLQSAKTRPENSAVATGLEKVSFHSNPKERQSQRMLKTTAQLHSPHTLIK